jgi:hypothetical protein
MLPFTGWRPRNMKPLYSNGYAARDRLGQYFNCLKRKVVVLVATTLSMRLRTPDGVLSSRAVTHRKHGAI